MYSPTYSFTHLVLLGVRFGTDPLALGLLRLQPLSLGELLRRQLLLFLRLFCLLLLGRRP